MRLFGIQPSRVILFLVVILFLSFEQRSHAAQSKPAWQLEWEKTVEAAKKEGQVVIYISGYEAVLQDFEKDYPEIKVTAVTGRGNQLGPASTGGTARRKISRRCFQHRALIPITSSFTRPRRSTRSSRR